jgi:hypothetical protein
MSTRPNTDLPSYELELRAAEERKRLHTSMQELRQQVSEKLDVKKNARRHVASLSAAAALFSFVVGYAFAGIFTRH